MTIGKVVIPVAGFGTRLLPTTKALPKEMLPVGRFPAIQHVVEEMAGAGLAKVLFITSRAKTIIENQFDNNADIVHYLDRNGRLQDLGDFDYARRGVEFFYSRQQVPPGVAKPRGTGDAIAAAESFVDGEPFAVAYGDTIIRSPATPTFLERMIAAHAEAGAVVTLGVRPVPDDLVSRYGIVSPARGEDTARAGFRIDDVVEKPTPDRAPSRLAVSARYIFSPLIFEEIRKLDPGPDDEVGVTDAIRALIRAGHTVCGVPLVDGEARYDIGSHESYYKAFLDFALDDPVCGAAIREYVSRRALPSGGAA